MEKLKYPIYLIGLPGSGKSSIGILLSKKMNLKHIDLDKKIIEKENTNIYDLIKIKGEKYFRFIETEILKKNSYGKKIISCGGGIVLNPSHKNIMKKGTVVYLITDLEKIKNRLSRGKKRPLMEKYTIEQLHNIRKKKYIEFSDLVVENNKEKKDVVDKIISKLEELIWKY